MTRDSDRRKELLRMFKAGHVWTCKKCGGAINKSGFCSNCGAANNDALSASFCASVAEGIVARKKEAAAERRRSNRAAAKAMALGKAESTPVTPSDTQLPKRVKASMVIEPEAENPTLAPPPVAPCPTCGALLSIFERCEPCYKKAQETEQRTQEVEAQQNTVDGALLRQQASVLAADRSHKSKFETMSFRVVGLLILLVIWRIVAFENSPSNEQVPNADASAITRMSPGDGVFLPAKQGASSCDVEHNGGLTQQIVTYAIDGKTYAINGQARQRAAHRGWIDGKTIFTPDQMLAYLSEGLEKCAAMSPSPSSPILAAEGSQDDRRRLNLEAEGSASMDADTLIRASEHGDVETVKRYIAAKFDVNRKGAGLPELDIEGGTAIAGAAAKGHVEILMLLLASGAKVEPSADEFDVTPLMLAAQFGHAACVKILLDNGARVNARGIGGDTPLILAAYAGHLEAARQLVEKGASLTAKNKDDDTAYRAAMYFGNKDVARYLKGKGGR